MADRFQADFIARKLRRNYFPHVFTVMWPSPLCVLGKEAEGALIPETPRQLAHSFRVRVSLHGPLGGGPVVKED